MAINISFIVANQLFYSVQLKSNEKIHKAVFLDAGFILHFFVCVLGVQCAWQCAGDMCDITRSVNDIVRYRPF